MTENELPNTEDTLHNVTSLAGLYENWFLDYASYVILDRAVPHIHDGLKPVQRRILHSLKEMDDGRFNKAANVIGNTMKYHPHGDASIGDAMVQIGQKNLLIDTQGNWGDPFTGDSAAAPRYIEARLSKFALEVVFNPDTTNWQLSYDGRNREPITLPVKFPLVLAQGADGIAVGLATKILPHNFNELIDASIEILKGNRPEIFPDFATGGFADVSKYNNGQRGGRVRVRAKIIERDKKTLVITEIPFTTTTSSLIDSVISANDKGKIKIKKIEDNTAKDVEIVIHLAPGISPDMTIDALYAFTDCEISISPNTCVIKGDRPHFMNVNDILEESTQFTKALLKQELEIKRNDLNEKWHFSSLEKIFIEERIYRDLEQAESEEHAISIIDNRLEPFKVKLKREVTEADILKLMEIRIKRITKYDTKKADELLISLDEEILKVEKDLKNLTAFAIKYFEKLKEKYGKGRERKTELRLFDDISAAQVALANVKLYVNREDGFVGTGLKKDEFVCDCSDIDDIICFRSDGKFTVTKVAEKTFVGKDIIYVGVFKKGDERTIYHLIYRDGANGKSYIKRFAVTGITRDKEYDLTKGAKSSKVLYFTANPNGESEVVTVHHKPVPRLRKLTLDADFADVAIKGRASQGNILSKYPIKKIIQKSKGVSTLSGIKIWYDEVLMRLNTDARGKYLGSFEGDDKIIAVYQNGSYELTSFELTNRYDDVPIVIEKYKEDKVASVVYLDGKSKNHYVKRFIPEPISMGRKVSFISEAPGSNMLVFSFADTPIIDLKYTKGKAKDVFSEEVNLAAFMDVKGMKAIGNKLSAHIVKSVNLKEEIEEEREEKVEEIADVPKQSAAFEITNPDDVELRDGQLGLF